MARRSDLDATLRSLALAQHGAVARRQAAAVGVDKWAIRRRIDSGAWRLATPRVVVLGGAGPTFEQDCMVAVLDAGHDAVVSGPAAARLWVSLASRRPKRL